MPGMWDQVLLLELSGVGAVPFLCISSLLAAPKGVKGVKEDKYFSGGMKVEMSSLNCLCLYSLNRLDSYQGCSTKEPSKKVSPFN